MSHRILTNNSNSIFGSNDFSSLHFSFLHTLSIRKNGIVDRFDFRISLFVRKTIQEKIHIRSFGFVFAGLTSQIQATNHRPSSGKCVGPIHSFQRSRSEFFPLAIKCRLVRNNRLTNRDGIIGLVLEKRRDILFLRSKGLFGKRRKIFENIHKMNVRIINTSITRTSRRIRRKRIRPRRTTRTTRRSKLFTKLIFFILHRLKRRR
mmetsp:Transcript_11094/g.16739  ORF Transcript_11094/g.16739 Transcript_11094/m.16739 type:complete len:205 (+) Transcript_11094:1686-2300(+)